MGRSDLMFHQMFLYVALLNAVSVTNSQLHPIFPVGFYGYPPPQHLQEVPDYIQIIAPSIPQIQLAETQSQLRPLYTYTTSTFSTTRTIISTLTETSTSTLTVPSTSSVTSTSYTTTTVTTTPTQPAALGYTYVNGLGWYKAYSTLVTFEAAKTRCEQDGARLIILNSKTEADKMVAMLTTAGAARGWVGLTDSVTEGTILTIFGDPLSTTYEKWALGEINNAPDWDCVYMDVGVAGMAMYDCVNILSSFVCEI